MTHIERRQPRQGKESIHSGHFMVSHFEAEAQDDFDDLAVPVPDEEQNTQKVTVVATYNVSGAPVACNRVDKLESQHQQLSIETSLTKLFRCMTLAYRQKLTSPKWNRFKGIKLRWKDKIRLNNVIWRCWHMQFIKKQNTLVCQFASPLDVDTHVKPETTILEGKYWKRRAEAVIAEYKKWRMFHIMRLLGKGDTSVQDTISDMDTAESFSQCSELAGAMLTDEDYLNFMSDTLFSTISNHQPFAFPDPREIARGASLADFIQPSLGPLQPNLDDFMDTLEPLHDLLTPRLPPVPEEAALAPEHMYRPLDGYQHTYLPTQAVTIPPAQMSIHSNQGSSTNQLGHHQSSMVKPEQQQQQGLYDGSRQFHADLVSSLMQDASSFHSADPHPPPPPPVYGGKGSRLHYAASPKIVTHTDNTNISSYKYQSVIPPSQTAPETVSLLQQPIQNPKYSPGVLQGRSGYERSKSRPRIAHYTSQLPAAASGQYGGYAGGGGARQAPYLQPAPAKTGPATSRAFKMPSPPLAPATHATHQVQASSSRGSVPATAAAAAASKENYRSSSLPLGAQLNPDWSITTVADTRHSTPRREEAASPLRLRSRSSSSSALVEGGAGAGAGGGEGRRPPPPLHSVASEPALPQASVMLAQLLATQHSQSVYKLNETGGGSEPGEAAGGRRAPRSPLDADLSPHQMMSCSPAGSPPASPGSPASRRSHMHAEQKRRYNIKTGFDTLQALIPQLNNNPTAKISKAAMLQKGAEYIKQLKAERNQIKEEMESLRQQIECLNNSISNCHSLLPATGAPVSRARAGRLREMFANHVAARTMHNWKYWLFSVVAAGLLESFSACVSCSSGADLVRSTLLWAEQHCSLVEMRPAVLNSLRQLCTSTEILTNPERLPDEARAAVAAASRVKAEPT